MSNLQAVVARLQQLELEDRKKEQEEKKKRAEKPLPKCQVDTTRLVNQNDETMPNVEESYVVDVLLKQTTVADNGDSSHTSTSKDSTKKSQSKEKSSDTTNYSKSVKAEETTRTSKKTSSTRTSKQSDKRRSSSSQRPKKSSEKEEVSSNNVEDKSQHSSLSDADETKENQRDTSAHSEPLSKKSLDNSDWETNRSSQTIDKNTSNNNSVRESDSNGTKPGVDVQESDKKHESSQEVANSSKKGEHERYPVDSDNTKRTKNASKVRTSKAHENGSSTGALDKHFCNNNNGIKKDAEGRQRKTKLSVNGNNVKLAKTGSQVSITGDSISADGISVRSRKSKSSTQSNSKRKSRSHHERSKNDRSNVKNSKNGSKNMAVDDQSGSAAEETVTSQRSNKTSTSNNTKTSRKYGNGASVNSEKDSGAKYDDTRAASKTTAGKSVPSSSKRTKHGSRGNKGKSSKSERGMTKGNGKTTISEHSGNTSFTEKTAEDDSYSSSSFDVFGNGDRISESQVTVTLQESSCSLASSSSNLDSATVEELQKDLERRLGISISSITSKQKQTSGSTKSTKPGDMPIAGATDSLKSKNASSSAEQTPIDDGMTKKKKTSSINSVWAAAGALQNTGKVDTKTTDNSKLPGKPQANSSISKKTMKSGSSIQRAAYAMNAKNASVKASEQSARNAVPGQSKVAEDTNKASAITSIWVAAAAANNNTSDDKEKDNLSNVESASKNNPSSKSTNSSKPVTSMMWAADALKASASSTKMNGPSTHTGAAERGPSQDSGGNKKPSSFASILAAAAAAEKNTPGNSATKKDAKLFIDHEQSLGSLPAKSSDKTGTSLMWAADALKAKNVAGGDQSATKGPSQLPGPVKKPSPFASIVAAAAAAKENNPSDDTVMMTQDSTLSADAQSNSTKLTKSTAKPGTSFMWAADALKAKNTSVVGGDQSMSTGQSQLPGVVKKPSPFASLLAAAAAAKENNPLDDTTAMTQDSALSSSAQSNSSDLTKSTKPGVSVMWAADALKAKNPSATAYAKLSNDDTAKPTEETEENSDESKAKSWLQLWRSKAQEKKEEEKDELTLMEENEKEDKKRKEREARERVLAAAPAASYSLLDKQYVERKTDRVSTLRAEREKRQKEEEQKKLLRRKKWELKRRKELKAEKEKEMGEENESNNEEEEKKEEENTGKSSFWGWRGKKKDTPNQEEQSKSEAPAKKE